MEVLEQVKVIVVVMPDGSEELLECPLQLVCALAIVKGVAAVADVARLHTVTLDEYQRAVALRRHVSPQRAQSPPLHIDVPRVTRDGKYALHVQDLIGGLTAEAVSRLVTSTLRGQVLSLSLNSFGCRVVQKVIEIASPDTVLAMIHPELSERLVECAMDVNGNHVIQKLVDSLPSADCAFIVEAMVGNEFLLTRLASHCYGCRVVQRVMAKCNAAQTEPLLEALCANPAAIASLSEDVFGNYVMQHAIDYGRHIDRERICLCIASMDVVGLSCSKFASNVIEKLVRCHNKPALSSPNSVLATKLMINSTLAPTPTGELGIITLMKDRYGNYVVRAMIELARADFAPEVELVKRLILQNAPQLKKFTFSWHLVERLDKMAEAKLLGL